jgi:acyl dehydratase
MVWRKPVLVGDSIRFSTQVISKRPTSKAGLGLVQSLNRAVNQRGELVMDFTAAVITPIGS